MGQSLRLNTHSLQVAGASVLPVLALDQAVVEAWEAVLAWAVEGRIDQCADALTRERKKGVSIQWV